MSRKRNASITARWWRFVSSRRRANAAFRQGKVGGYLHLYIGQEAVATGLLDAYKPGDKIITAYRDHAHALLLGSHPNEVMAELYGKGTGLVKGKGGSMHLFDVKNDF